jgi:hypothetical protein
VKKKRYILEKRKYNYSYGEIMFSLFDFTFSNFLLEHTCCINQGIPQHTNVYGQYELNIVQMFNNECEQNYSRS